MRPLPPGKRLVMCWELESEYLEEYFWITKLFGCVEILGHCSPVFLYNMINISYLDVTVRLLVCLCVDCAPLSVQL